MNTIQLNYKVPIQVVEYPNGDSTEFVIQGIAINSTITDNRHKFLPEELKLAAGSMNNVPLLIDHENTVSSIVGRVILAEFNSVDENIMFKARINDTPAGKHMRQLIKAGDLNTVSIGANVADIEESEDGFIPRGITFKELSLVAVPADSDATFTFTGANFELALKEAWQAKEKEREILSPSHLSDIVGKTQLNIKEEKEMTTDESKTISQSDSEVVTEAIKESKELVTLKADMTSLSEKLNAQSEVLSEVLASIKKLSEADVDEAEVETPVEPVEAVVEPEVEVEAEESKEEPKVEEPTVEEPEEEEEVEEKSGYKLVQGYKSFTVERSKY